MDLQLFLRVIWRFKWIMVAGSVLAVALSILSYARVSFANGRPTLTYRVQELWQSSERLLITQAGFPWGRAVQGYLPGNPTTGTPSIPVGDAGRLTELAELYATFANSDAVQRVVAKSGDEGAVSAQVVTAPNNPSQLTPMLDISAIALTPSAAVDLAQRGTEAFQRYIEDQQTRANIPAGQRVIVQVMNKASGASVAKPRKKTLPIVVFLAVMIATVCLAFVLENLKPRLRLLETRDEMRDAEATPSRAARA